MPIWKVLHMKVKKKCGEPSDPDTVFVAENEDGQIVGFAGFGQERTGEYGFDGELYAIYLLKKVQGAGIGRRLAEAVADELIRKNYQSMLLWVMNANPSKASTNAFHLKRLRRTSTRLREQVIRKRHWDGVT